MEEKMEEKAVCKCGVNIHLNELNGACSACKVRYWKSRSKPECPYGHKSQYLWPNLQVIITRIVNKKGEILYYSLYCGICDHQYTEEQMITVLEKLKSPQQEFIHEKISLAQSINELYLETLAPIFRPLINLLIWLIRDLKLAFSQVYAYVYADKLSQVQVENVQLAFYSEPNFSGLETSDGIPIVSWSMLVDEGMAFPQDNITVASQVVEPTSVHGNEIELAAENPG